MTSVIGTLIGVIVILAIFGVIWWAITQLLPLLPLPPPFARIIDVLLRVILVLIVLWVILVLLGAAGVHVPFFHADLASRTVATLSIATPLNL
jgi:hypothetical protein